MTPLQFIIATISNIFIQQNTGKNVISCVSILIHGKMNKLNKNNYHLPVIRDVSQAFYS